MNIRPAEMADAKDLHWLSSELGYLYPLEKLKINLARAIADDKHCLLVAILDGKVYGYCHAEDYEPLYADHVLNILGLVVDQTKQRQGIGSRLLAEMATVALSKGMTAIRLNSSQERVAAHIFYEKNGYVSKKQQKHFMKRLK